MEKTANKEGISRQAVSFFQTVGKGAVFKPVGRAILVILPLD